MATLRQGSSFGPRRARRRKPHRRVWLWILLGALGLMLGGVLYTMTMVGVAVQEISQPLPVEVAPEVRPAPVKRDERVNILVLGLDEDRVRSDVMLLVSCDPVAKKVGVLQIPRDTRTMLAGKGTVGKINGAYAYGMGDKQFPPNLRALKTVESLLDVTINYTMVIDLAGFRQAIDSIGGVSVQIPRVMDYDDPTQNLHIHLQPGPQKLNGQQALEFVRWRHNNDGTGYPDGDLGRIRTQQQFLNALLDKLLRPANLPLLPGQLVAVSRFVDSNIEPGRLLSLAGLAATIRKDDVEFATIPGTDAYMYDSTEGKQLSFFLPDLTATRQLVDRLIRPTDSGEEDLAGE